jgi:adenylate cyclase
VTTGALAFLTGEAAARRGDARVLRLSIAFVCASGFLGLHALATPGVLLSGKNAGFQVASAVGLLLASPVAAWSALELDERGSSLVGRRGWLYSALGGVLALWAAISLATLPPLEEPIEDPGPLLLGLFAGGAVLYGLAAGGYARLYRRRRRPLLLAAIAAFVLLAEAMLAVGLGRNWHTTWWEWHLLMLVAFAAFARAVWREWQREGPAEIWADVYEDATWGREEEISVLFADLQGFTRYSETHSEADVREMLDAYFEAGIPALRTRARNVRTIGDAVMAYFTGEGHEQVAAAAALAFQEHVGAVASAHPDWPRFRAGLNSGRASIGLTAEAREETVRGDAVNVSARLEGQARAGEVVIGEATRAALGPGAVTEDLGELPVKGKERPVRAHVLRSLAASGQDGDQRLDD